MSQKILHWLLESMPAWVNPAITANYAMSQQICGVHTNLSEEFHVVIQAHNIALNN